MTHRCPFCAIEAGDADAAEVVRDRHAFAILDRRQPGWPGSAHVLVMPRQHVPDIAQLPPELAGPLMQLVVRVAQVVRRVCRPEGISVWQSNGPAAGQEVSHVHVHVLTRVEGDELLRVYAQPPKSPPLRELDLLAARFRSELTGQ